MSPESHSTNHIANEMERQLPENTQSHRLPGQVEKFLGDRGYETLRLEWSYPHGAPFEGYDCLEDEEGIVYIASDSNSDSIYGAMIKTDTDNIGEVIGVECEFFELSEEVRELIPGETGPTAS